MTPMNQTFVSFHYFLEVLDNKNVTVSILLTPHHRTMKYTVITLFQYMSH